jgi:predicted nucleic acid-binding protein
MYDKIIVDADICIKLGSKDKYPFLTEVLPLLAKEIYIHSQAYSEVLIPDSARRQLNVLVSQKKVIVVNETELEPKERCIYDMVFNQLANVMIDPRRPNKNKGETCSLAYAKVKAIPVFVTDEKDLQPIIDSQLNTGLNDIRCIRINDIVVLAKNGDINIPRKKAKAIWVLSGQDKAVFDNSIWPLPPGV